MKHFKDFLIKLQTLDVKIIQKTVETNQAQSQKAYYDLSHQNPYLSDQFRNELKELRELALTDILNLPLEQIEFQLKRLEEVKAMFDSFWNNFYSSRFPGGSEFNNEFLYSLNLGKAFIVPDLSDRNYAIVKDQFIDDLQDTIQSRENALIDFEKSVLRVVPINKDQEKAAAKSFRQAEKAGPVFKEAAAAAFFDLIKDYFVPDEQLPLKNLLTSGTEPGIPLVFMGKGNQLADAFKQLFEANLIVGCNKTELINWILQHFAYRDKGAVKNFVERYLQAIISSNLKGCLSPILDVRKKEGQFLIYPTQKNNRNSK